MIQYAVIDPNWGEPAPVIGTLADSEDAAKNLAIHNEGLALYSGASFVCVPPMIGNWENLKKHGYKIGRVKLELLD